MIETCAKNLYYLFKNLKVYISRHGQIFPIPKTHLASPLGHVAHSLFFLKTQPPLRTEQAQSISYLLLRSERA